MCRRLDARVLAPRACTELANPMPLPHTRSRVDAGRSGFRNPVGLIGFDIRYEVEVLRCSQVEVPGESGAEPRTAQACCTDLDFPCQPPAR